MSPVALKSTFQEGLIGIRLIGTLAGYLKKSLTADEAKAILEQRLVQRDSDFVKLVKTCIYDLPKNPYHRLLKHAGCEFGDFENLTVRHGIEATLQELFSKGVYLTSQEFLGGSETVRGSLRFHVESQHLRNPFVKRHIPIRSSGSRSHGIPVIRDLDFVFDNTVSLAVWLEARGLQEARIATWSVPGGVTLSNLIKFTSLGRAPIRWFSQLDTGSNKLDPRYRWSSRLLAFSGKLAGVSIPTPEHVSLEDPRPVIAWMQDCVKNGETPHLFTFSSSAVRAARCALDAGIDLGRVHITMTGEPVTPARLEYVRRSGAQAFPAMGCVEVGHVGYGCLNPRAADDMHLMKDLQVIIQPEKQKSGSGLNPKALLFSTLRASAPLILLNYSNGDQAEIEKAECGCPLGSSGYDIHLSHVRSFEKLTSGGMAFLDTDIVDILEKELPQAFGGGPTDYQLREDEATDGTPRLHLVVHPRLGPLDEAELKAFFLNKVGSGAGAEKLTSLLWQQADVLCIERRIPSTTLTGKIQHMHARKSGLSAKVRAGSPQKPDL